MMILDNSGPKFSLPDHLTGDVRDHVLQGGSTSDHDRMQRPLRTQFDFWLLALLMAVKAGLRPGRGLPEYGDGAVVMPKLRKIASVFPSDAPTDVASQGVRVPEKVIVLLSAIYVADHKDLISAYLTDGDAGAEPIDVSGVALMRHLDRYAAAGSDLLLERFRQEDSMDQMPYQTLRDMIIELSGLVEDD